MEWFVLLNNQRRLFRIEKSWPNGMWDFINKVRQESKNSLDNGMIWRRGLFCKKSKGNDTENSFYF